MVGVDGEAMREGTSSGAGAAEMVGSDGERQVLWSSSPVVRRLSLAIAAIVWRAAKVQCVCVERCR